MPPFFPSYIPSGRFAFTRSYVDWIQVRHDPPAPIWVGTEVQFIVAGAPDALVKVGFKPEFYNWSSNNYTLDWVVDYATYEYPPVPTVFGLPFYLSFKPPIDKSRYCLEIDAMYGAEYSLLPLPPAPPDYWLPPVVP